MLRSCGSTSTSTRPKAKALLAQANALLADEKASSNEKKRFPLLATYELALKCSNLFNLLDARGAISVTERVGVIGRIRTLAVGVAKAYALQQACASAIERAKRDMADFLVEIGLEEVPARMIAGAEAELGRRVREVADARAAACVWREGDHLFDAAAAGGAGGRRAGRAGRCGRADDGAVVEGGVQGRRADGGRGGICEEGRRCGFRA